MDVPVRTGISEPEVVKIFPLTFINNRRLYS